MKKILIIMLVMFISLTLFAWDPYFGYRIDGKNGDVRFVNIASFGGNETTTADSYANPFLFEWTAGADMTAGGSNGIYSICNAIEDLQNAYALRGRMDLSDQETEAVAVNQLHAIDGLFNLSDQAYTVMDNMSVYGAAMHSVDITAGAITVGSGGVGTLNLYYGVWGPSMAENFSSQTNGMYLVTHANTHMDYGVHVDNSGTMQAGLWIDGHPSNSPASYGAGILMTSAASKIGYGVDMSGAGIVTADLKLSDASIISGATTNGATLATATGFTNVNAVGGLNVTTITFSSYSMPIVDSGANGGHGTLKLIDFPEGIIRIPSAIGDMSCTSVTGMAAASEVDMALGSATTLTDAEELGNTNVDFIGKVDETLTAGVGVWDLVNTTSQDEDGHSGSTDVWLCVAVLDTNMTGAGTIILNGTIVITWHNMGDY